MNIEEEKLKYKTPEEWASVQHRDYIYMLKRGLIEELNETYIGDLALCETWEQVEDIINRYNNVNE